MKSSIGSIRYLAISLFAFCLLGLSTAHAQDGRNRHVLVINETSFTLEKFYASNIGTNDWQEDILGLGVLAPGRSVNVNIDDGSSYCHFDLKAVFSNGQQVIRRNVNVCQLERWILED
jgi:hypothetical protein